MKDFPKADIGKRIISYLIDGLIINIPFFLFICPLIIMFSFLEESDETSSFLTACFMCFLFLGGFIGWGYFLIRDGLPNGSFGRRVGKQRLIDLETGEPTGYGKSALRNLIFSFLGFIDIIVALVHDKGQSVSDIIVKTQVVDWDK